MATSIIGYLNRRAHALVPAAPSDAGDGMVNVTVAVTGDRTAIQALNVGGIALRQVPAAEFGGRPGDGYVWSGRVPAQWEKQNLVLVGRYYGPTPILVYSEFGQPDPRKARSQYFTTYRRLLNDRATRDYFIHGRARRMFLRFDAWSQPEIMRLLIQPEFVALLNEDAKALFATDLPFDESMIDLVSKMAVYLHELAKWRALTLAVEAQITARWNANQKDDVRRVAEFVLNMLHRPIDDVEVSQDEWSAAFQHFALGSLGFVPIELDPERPDKPPVMALLNIEPNSSYCFSFAELSLLAAELDPANAQEWAAWLANFVAREDEFLSCYGPEFGLRISSRYDRRTRRKAAPTIDVCAGTRDTERDARLARLDRTGGTAALLQVLQKHHTINVAFAFRDET